jgi:hypothetical protein
VTAAACGGEVALGNLACCCASCNATMGTTNLIKFAKRFRPRARLTAILQRFALYCSGC